ncbi:MAG: molybdopterin-binding protein [Candidatus Nanopelagicales bacterium]|nr:molybdopterin-binding protein [Candidatus Nanopelagicales bacterium]
MSTYGLDGVLAWEQAFHVATTSGRALPTVAARLDEAGGSILGKPLLRLTDEPAADSAQSDGYAICGEGPWLAVADTRLQPGECMFLHAGQPIPDHTDAVISVAAVEARKANDDSIIVIALDALTGVIDESVRPELGSGIARQASRATLGSELVPAGRQVTAAVLALAASSGHDFVEIVRPPVVGTVVLGHTLLSQGLPRDGRIRDALGDAVAHFAGSQGARSNPPLRAPDTAQLLLEHIDDANVDILITTGSTAPTPDNHVRQVMSDLGARWLIDGVASTPGTQMLLAKLPDGRFVVGLPGEPASALAGLLTIVAPLIRGMRGAPAPVLSHAVLVDEPPIGDYQDDTRLVPVTLSRSGSNLIAKKLSGSLNDISDWANADGIAFIAPDVMNAGTSVPIISL